MRHSLKTCSQRSMSIRARPKICLRKSKRIKTTVDALKQKMIKLEEQHTELGSRVNYINKNFDLAELLKGVNLDDLKRVMNSNQVINRNIEELLNKWDGMGKIGRGQSDAPN